MLTRLSASIESLTKRASKGLPSREREIWAVPVGSMRPPLADSMAMGFARGFGSFTRLSLSKVREHAVSPLPVIFVVEVDVGGGADNEEVSIPVLLPDKALLVFK
jgi:hypothetical protein